MNERERREAYSDSKYKKEGAISRYERYRYSRGGNGSIPRTAGRYYDSIPPRSQAEIDAKDRELYGWLDEEEELEFEEGELIASLPAVLPGIPASVMTRFGTSLGTRGLWRAFARIVARRFGERAAIALGLSAGDGPLPIGEIISLGLAAATVYEIYQLWDELWAETAQELANPNSQIVVTTEPENQIYTTPNEEQRRIEHTGSPPPHVQTGTPPFDTEAGRETVEGQQNTGGQYQQEVDWDNYIFESDKNPWRGDFVLNDGNLREGWIHIDARHITGNHPKGPGDLFEPNTTRSEVEALARKVIKKGVRISDPSKVMQTFEYKTKFQGKRERFKASVKTTTEELITVYPARSE